MSEILSEITRIGCPWHGLIQGGQILLSSGSAINYPQPSASGDPVGTGDTLLQRMPWAPGDTADAEQQLTDQAAGQQWADYAILSGKARQLHGTPLDGWIYAGPDGRPWLISESDIRSGYSANSFDGTIKARLFGALGAAAEEYFTPTLLSDCGQTGFDSLAAPQLEVMDIMPDGSRAIIMLWIEAGQGYTAPQHKIAVGFLEMALTGTPGADFAIGLTVLRTRTEVLGSFADSGVPPLPVRNAYNLSTAFEETTDEVGGYPDCTGHRDAITTPVAAMPTASGTGERPVDVDSAERSRTISDKILAMWYVDGIPLAVTITVRDTFIREWGDLQQILTGQRVQRRDHTGVFGGSCSVGPLYEVSDYERVLTCRRRNVRRSAYTISFAGQSQAWSAELEDVTDYYRRETSQTATEESSYQNTIQSPVGGETQSGVASVANFPWTTNQAVGPSASAPNDNAWLRAIEFSPEFYLTADFCKLDLLRYSNNCLALLVQYGAWTAGSVITPAGMVAGNHAGTSQSLYGSHNPATGQLVRGESTPLCWT